MSSSSAGRVEIVLSMVYISAQQYTQVLKSSKVTYRPFNDANNFTIFSSNMNVLVINEKNYEGCFCR